MSTSSPPSPAAPDRRVLHVVLDYGLFSHTFVSDAMEELDRLGWEAWLLTRSVEHRELFPFPPHERLLHMSRRPNALRVAGVFAGSPPYSWARASLDAVAARVRPTLVHAHFGWSALDAERVARSAGVPLVVSFHGADVAGYPRFPAWELPRRLRTRQPHRYGRLFPAIDQAIVPSAVVAERLRELGWTGPVEVLPSGLRVEEFPLRAAPPAGGPPRLLFVGRLVRRKGVDVLLRALVALPDVRLEVCGDGEERGALERLAAELDLGERVRFLGVRDRDQVREALRSAHALVLPSRTMPDSEVETLGMVILEALATGVPVLATRSGGIAAAVPPTQRHELVPEDDPGALAVGIRRLLADPDQAERVRAGREWVENEYDWAHLARRVEDVYQRALNAPGLRSGS